SLGRAGARRVVRGGNTLPRGGSSRGSDPEALAYEACAQLRRRSLCRRCPAASRVSATTRGSSHVRGSGAAFWSARMLILRADPWMPEYGMGFDVRLDEPDATIDPYVETRQWSTPRCGVRPDRVPVCFVDGVRRIDLRLLADADGRRVPGLF